ncbi:hypothetical protein ABGB18_35770 [Nonomuraea sp. B12E4]|uniref:hypothetical protein n=1 Tax=Nonomuraea sp. B12E4 TaxID=3153564 RepID=UPI00325E3883
MRIAARVQGRPVTGHPLIAVVDRLAGGLDGDEVELVVLGGQESLDGLFEGGRVEDLAEPGIQLGEDVVLADVDGARVLDLVGQGVLDGELAPVVGAAVVPRSFHSPLAHTAVQQVPENVRTRGAARLTTRCRATVGRQQRLRLFERLGVDERLVNDHLRPDPLLLGIPLELGHMPLGDVVDVEQFLLLVLFVPDLAARVARVEEDRPNGRLGPRDPRAVPIASPVIGGRARNVLLGQPLGDQIKTLPLNEIPEDPRHMGSRQRVGLQTVKPLAVCRLARVGVRSRIREPVTIRRAPAQEAAFDLRLSFHGGADAHLDAVALALTDPAEHQHDQLVGLVGGVNRSADLGHPQGHPVVIEELEGIAELVAVEGPLWLAHYDGVESPVGVAQLAEQGSGLRSPLRRDRS